MKEMKPKVVTHMPSTKASIPTAVSKTYKSKIGVESGIPPIGCPQPKSKVGL